MLTNFIQNSSAQRLVAMAAVVAGCGLASAANYSVGWLNQGPTPFGLSYPSGSVFNLPGVGPVTVTYSLNPAFSDARVDANWQANGSVVNGPDTYSWGNLEVLGRTNIQPAPPLNSSWSVTYSFPGTVSAQSLVVGITGLGRRDDPIGGTPGAVTTATCTQNGTYLGEFFGIGGPYGANQFTGGPGIFSLENSVTGVGGANPHWNTALALVRIDDAVNSLTVRFDQTSGDGVGVNIGVLVPSPGTAALIGLGALPAVVRRRRG